MAKGKKKDKDKKRKAKDKAAKRELEAVAVDEPEVEADAQAPVKTTGELVGKHAIRRDRPSFTMPEENMLYGLSNLFKIFADPTRLKILFSLVEGPKCVADISAAAGVTQCVPPPVSSSSRIPIGLWAHPARSRWPAARLRISPRYGRQAPRTGKTGLPAAPWTWADAHSTRDAANR